MQKLLYQRTSVRILSNSSNIIFLLLVFSLLLAISWVCSHLGGDLNYTNIKTLVPYQNLSTSLWNLPRYAADTTVRMLIALLLSLFFSLLFGAWAAKNKKAENWIIPAIDILQSIPILGFLSITVSVFLAISPHSLWGAQMAVIFGLFTAQTWNMLLSFYQSIKTIPKELKEVARMYQLSTWQCFWKLEIPFAIPSLAWNIMMSMAASWFIIVASEAIVVNFSQTTSAMINLPGIGSFISQANKNQDFIGIFAAIGMMLLMIILHDQLLFKPIIAWSERFFVTDQQVAQSTSWLLKLLQKSTIISKLKHIIKQQAIIFINLKYFRKSLVKQHNQKMYHAGHYKASIIQRLGYRLFVTTLFFCFGYFSWKFVYNNPNNCITFSETVYVFGYGLATALRVLILIIISSVIWLPIGIWIGLRPKIAKNIQPYVQILAAFPINLIYGLFGTLVITFNLNFNIWCILLMALGTQWYILFNVIAGASTIPYELKMAARNMQLKGITKWKNFLCPAVIPFYITGAISAAGGAWNASIVCEYINWGGESTIMATGIGAYISQQYQLPGDHTANIALSVIVMCILVVLTNKLFWQQLYNYTEKRFSISI